ncbi:hypothetical protein bAD24_III11355 [Burkholderia sp. AD24]|nr:hypothetical protein bAD24_III11355 [Burkholderia sp. AD24]
MSDNQNVYRYGLHTNLRPVDLFVFVALDETRKQPGLDELASAAAILLGNNDIPVAGKLGGAVTGTSVASLAARRILPFNVAIRLPTITRDGIGGLRIAMTRSLGAFVGRAIPVIGVVVLARDVFLIMRHPVMMFNRLVRPEDRIF